MLAANFTTLRNNLKNYCDEVSDNNETVIVTRKKEKNIVILSLEKYNELEKAAKNAEYLAMIDRRMEKYLLGKYQQHELIDEAWEEYLYWQVIDKKIVKKINELLKDISRNGVSEGIGEPESLKYRKAWSRRINKKHRLVYFIENSNIVILSCKGHYEE